MSIDNKLEYLLGTKESIKSAIEYMGVNVPSNTTFRNYARLIKNISVSDGGGEEEESLPTLGVPAIYASAFEQCMKNHYPYDFENIMVMTWFGENESYICIIFLTKDFKVTYFDPNTTEFKAKGWFSCVLKESTGAWTTYDYRTTASTGGNYICNIVYASTYIKYNSTTLFPVGMQSTDLVNSKYSLTILKENSLSYSFNNTEMEATIKEV